MATSKFPARLWLWLPTNVGEDLFSLTPEEFFIFEQLAKHYYAPHAE